MIIHLLQTIIYSQNITYNKTIIYNQRMQVEKQLSTLILPGEQVSHSNQVFNPSNIFQSLGSTLQALKVGEITSKQVKNDNKQTIALLDLLTFPILYEPTKGDLVIGTIKMKSAEYYTVDIGAPLDATLGALQFDGATKKNKPNIQQGSLIYCRVTEHSKYLGTKLSCINKGFNSQNDLGELKGGIKVEAPKFKHPLLESKLTTIAKYLKFQVAFGKNGSIWIKTPTLSTTVILYNVVKQILSGANDQLILQILQTAK